MPEDKNIDGIRNRRLKASELLPLVYDELRKLAGDRLNHERPGQTLNATGLVHEAYLRLVGKDNDQSWDNRGHFFAAAAESMRRILVDSARRKKRIKHGGGRQKVDVSPDWLAAGTSIEEVLAVDDVLDQLSSTDHQAGELVKLHYFAGLTIEEAAKVLEIPERTAYRVWKFARAWLRRKLSD